eukprot:CAMPEP_0117740944 /NCGR_PEP_ID=MMETSP0947-20121206/4628_1 /TAXON_ID=44440 /ORGANISM="Chattonella subsalsa, Strain CCMP2191" /LENGTH=816 /DNA_ID=CAMNT_0005557125 /DNA_START=123 /DNA_END=2573 /DNA_ORIENTATION=+
MEFWNIFKTFKLTLPIAFLLLGIEKNGAKELNIGIMNSWTVGWDGAKGINPAILIAFDALANETNLLPGYNISWAWMDSSCNAASAVRASLVLETSYNIHGFVGIPCSTACTRAGQIAEFFGFPMISYYSGSPLLSDKTDFPVVSRVVGPSTKMKPVLRELMDLFGWKNCALVSSNDDLNAPVAEVFLNYLTKETYDVTFYQTFTSVSSDLGSGSKISWMSQMKAKGVRVIFVLGYCQDVRDILLTAKDLDMIEGYSYFVFGVYAGCHEDLAGLNDGRSEEALELFDGIINLTWYTEITEEYSQFMDLMDERRMDFAAYSHPPNGPLKPNKITEWIGFAANDSAYDNPTTDEYDTIYDLSAFLYDAIYLYFLAANETLARGYDPSVDGLEIVESIKNFQFKGLTGDIWIDENGDRTPDVVMHNVRINGSEWDFVEAGIYHVVSDSLKLSLEESEILWPGGLGTVPVDLEIILPLCTDKDYTYVVSSCKRQSVRQVTFHWNQSVTCEGGVSLPQEVTVDCDYVPTFSKIGVTVIFVTVMGAVVGLSLLLFVILMHKQPWIKSAQPGCLVIYIGSAILVSLSYLLTLGKANGVQCAARVWLFHVSFTSMFGSLFLKVYKVWRIFGYKKLKKLVITFVDLLKGLAVLIFIDILILSVWMIIDPIRVVHVVDYVANVGEIDYHYCKLNTTFTTLLGMFHLGLVLFGMYMSYEVRAISDRFSETRHILFAIYNIALLCAITLLVTSFDINLSLKVLVGAIGYTFSCICGTCLVICPKILRVVRPEWYPEHPKTTLFPIGKIVVPKPKSEKGAIMQKALCSE